MIIFADSNKIFDIVPYYSLDSILIQIDHDIKIILNNNSFRMMIDNDPFMMDHDHSLTYKSFIRDLRHEQYCLYLIRYYGLTKDELLDGYKSKGRVEAKDDQRLDFKDIYKIAI